MLPQAKAAERTRAPASTTTHAAVAPYAAVPAGAAGHQDQLAVMLSRAIAIRRGGAPASGPLLQRDVATAAQALRDANIEKLNRVVFEEWLAKGDKMGTNAKKHGVVAGDLQAVRKAFEALAPTGGTAVADEKPKRYVPPPKAAAVTTPTQPVVAVTRPSARDMRLEFDDVHGKLHFGGKPTKKKSKWSLARTEAVTLMETEIRKHIDVLVRDSKLDGAEIWYVTGDNGKTIGHYRDTDGDSAAVTIFSMQVQVKLAERVIEFHGYPDERVQGVGAAKGRNLVGQ
jgi:hypothetical protein